MAGDPALIVRVTANLDDLKKNLAEGKAAIERTTQEVQQLAGTAQPGLDDLASSAEALTVKVEPLPGIFGQVRGGLTDVGKEAGFTFERLGWLGSATVVAATAMEAWDLGRTAAEFFGLDEKIAHATATLIGWGDAQAEASGAKQDTINLAIKHGADAHITYAEAIEFNTKRVNEWNDALIRSHAPEESAKQIAAWHGEIDKIRDAGVLKSFTDDVNSHNFSQKELADRYRISIGAVQEFARETKAANEIARAESAETAKREAVIARDRAQQQKEYEALLKHVQQLEADKNTASLTGLLGFSKAEQKATQDQFENESKAIDATEKAQRALHDFEMKGSMDSATYKIMKIWEEVDEKEKAFAKLHTDTSAYNFAVESLAAQQADAITATMAAALDTMYGQAVFTINKTADDVTARVNVALQQYSMVGGRKLSQSELDEYYKTAAGQEEIARNRGKRYYEGEILPRALGGGVAADRPYVVGERGPELFVPERSGTIVPTGGGSASGPTIIIHAINVTQPLGTPDAIGKAITARMRSLGMRLS